MQTSTENVSVRVTVQGFTENFSVDPLPDALNVGIVANVLINGAISYGDVVEWDSEGNVVAIRRRANRVTLIYWMDCDPDDLAMQALWEQVSQEAAQEWKRRGPVVGRGLDMLVASFEIRAHTQLVTQVRQLLAEVARDGLKLVVQVSPTPATTTDPDLLGLGVPAPVDDDDFDPSLLPDLSDVFVSAVIEEDVIQQLKVRGHVHAGLDDEEILDYAVELLRIDSRCYSSCERAHYDQVLVLAANTLCGYKGLMRPKLAGYVFETDFLADEA